MDELRCRCCGKKMPEGELILYVNMPKSAQFFPKSKDLKQEKGTDLILRQCLSCGLVQASGNPVPYYRDVIRASGVSEEMKEFRRKQYRSWVHQYHLSEKKILEIGAGTGEYMDMMENAGVHVFGLEHLSESVEKGKKAGHQMVEGFVENESYQIHGAPYDGFYSMNFLEHIPEPGAFLRGIAFNLSEQAVGLIEVPNFDMMVEKSLYSEFIQDHLSYFTKQTFKSLLEQNGFEVLSCGDVWYGYILSAVVKKRSLMDIEKFKQKQETLQKQIDNYLLEKQIEGKKAAVWGAGHQALANLSLLGMSGKIAYVVDSAEFKQGKYTPATHIPIVAPDRLKQREVQAVIIMVAGYSHEVKQILDRDYPWIESVILTEEGLHRSESSESSRTG